jgi:hypothetical protein
VQGERVAQGIETCRMVGTGLSKQSILLEIMSRPGDLLRDRSQEQGATPTAESLGTLGWVSSWREIVSAQRAQGLH